MGSSPVTATIPPSPPARTSVPPPARDPGETLPDPFGLDRFFTETAPVHAGEEILVAFSGGPDSTALAAALLPWARARGVRLAAAHLDHAQDPGSAGRARRAAEIARRLGLPSIVERRPAGPRRGESREAAGRRVRYRFLEEVRARRGARWVATAHHRDDQAETVLLRLAGGSGWEGLAGIAPVAGRVVRPLLAVPRAGLAAWLARELPEGVEPVTDPTNLDPAHAARNRLRRALLPRLAADDPSTPERLAALAATAAAARQRVRALLADRLRVHRVPGGAALDQAALAALAREREPLLGPALALLHRSAGAAYPASAAARRELRRQLVDPAAGSAVGCDAGRGWRWSTLPRPPGARDGGPELALLRPRPDEDEPTPPFSYTLEIPGELLVPETGMRLRVRPATREGNAAGEAATPDRVTLTLPDGAGTRLTVRNRRPGDRLRPLGGPGTRRLKDVLIDRKVPREERDRLPLVLVGGRIAWVPGVALDERFRPREVAAAWRLELLRNEPGAAT